tara:strand:- start:5265 stop:5558 length:294 start_codon:yes stop_codon:yes gene_type:complete
MTYKKSWQRPFDRDKMDIGHELAFGPMQEPVRCKECGDKCCVCDFGIEDNLYDLWCAHCQTCDMTHEGYIEGIPYTAKSKKEAILLWNKVNEAYIKN